MEQPPNLNRSQPNLQNWIGQNTGEHITVWGVIMHRSADALLNDLTCLFASLISTI